MPTDLKVTRTLGFVRRAYAWNLDCACALTSAGITSRIRRWSSDAANLARHGSSMKQGKVRMVKTRLAQWVSRWRERRLAREQKRQTSATRQATRDAEAQRYHSTGHGP